VGTGDLYRALRMHSLLIVRNFVIGCLLTCFISHPVWADDIEIFFNTASKDAIQPNLLFVLDASLSMDLFDCAEPDEDGDFTSNTSCDDDTPNGTTSRLERMNAALKRVLDQTTGVNVGLIRFAGMAGGRVIYPMRDLDEKICDSAECLKDKVFSAQGAVRSEADDAAENEAGLVSTSETAIPLMESTTPGTDPNSTSFVRFSDLRIPQGAIIEDARIHFHSATDSTSNDITFQVQDTGDAEPFVDVSDFALSDRSWEDLEVNWASNDAWVENGYYESGDVSALVSQVVARDDWCGGNSIAFKMKGTGDRSVVSYDADSGDRMVLKVRFKLPEAGGNSCMIREIHTPIKRVLLAMVGASCTLIKIIKPVYSFKVWRSRRERKFCRRTLDLTLRKIIFHQLQSILRWSSRAIRLSYRLSIIATQIALK